MNSEIIQTPHGPMEYIRLGQGPVVFISHGTSSNCFSIEALEPLVKAGFSLLSVSRPGYGRTPSSTGADNLQAARAVVCLLDRLEVPVCSVMAISGGGPTGIALAADHPQRVDHLILAEAISRTEDRRGEAAFKRQVAFYGPMHSLIWSMLQLASRVSPRSMARQTMQIFSQHDPDDVLAHLSPEDIRGIGSFYAGHSSRRGALNDLGHTVGVTMLQRVSAPTLVVHSREDASVPFAHAEWSLAHIPRVRLCHNGMTGHFFWIGPDYPRILQEIICFLQDRVT